MILGIDVGLTGAVAVLTDQGELWHVVSLPVMPNGKKAATVKAQVNAGELGRWLWQQLDIHRNTPKEALAFIEAQSARPGQGVSSVFSLGHSLGTVQAVLASIGIPFLMVSAQEWKRWYKLDHADKEASRTLAIQRFPSCDLHLKKDHNKAEAVLIARYGYERTQRREDV